MATAYVFNGNIAQAVFSLRKQMQRDQLMPKLRIKARHVSKKDRVKAKRRECMKRHARKKAMLAQAHV
ncbi:MAG: 30S ribosomal protein S21 [Alphaproteobacteria bacterium]|nr:30S ribosomal protein S21 [Rickettsiales bacterium]